MDGTPTAKDIERFWPKVAKAGPDDCWEWQAWKNKKGYGEFSYRGHMRPAHRFSWALAHDTWPDALVLHRCDNPSCVNPAHLFLGTAADNSADMLAKGRYRKGRVIIGTEHHSTNLTDADIVTIRSLAALGATQRQLSKQFGISQSSIWRIVNRVTWSHL